MGTDALNNEHALLRPGTLLLGVALAVFSAPGCFFPRFFARQVGLVVSDEPSAVAIRSVAIRDTMMGVGLISAAIHGGRLAPSLLLRALCDGGDAAAIGWAFARKGGNARLGSLGVLALVATIYDLALWRMARAD